MEFERNPRYLPDEPKNTLRGVVTPLTQELNGHSGVLTLSEIISDKQLLKRFEPGTFPKVEETSSGWFFSPISLNMYNMHQSYSKWFCVTPKGLIPNDHSYEYARLNTVDGFLLKVTIPVLANHIIDFQVNYAESVKEITPTSMGDTVENPMLTMPLFNPRKNAIITELVSNQQQFIQQYLQDIQAILEKE